MLYFHRREECMKYLFDLHTHTIASGHAYSTLQENIAAARDAGLKYYGFSDHTGSDHQDAFRNSWFTNFKVIPREIYGVHVLRGAETNLIDYEGHYDLSHKTAAKLDYMILSIHGNTYETSTAEVNTESLIKAMKDPYVRIIGHPDDGRFPLLAEPLAAAARENGVLLELNNSSLREGTHRTNTRENNLELLRACMKCGTMICLGSDAHISFDVGRFREAETLLEETGVPDELIANLTEEGLSRIIGDKKAY